MTAAEKFQALLHTHTKYDAEAYNFIYEALDWTLKHVVHKIEGMIRHVTGQELCEGFRQYAIEQFGCMALTVLEGWNVFSTDDVGSIIFNLIEFDLMAKQETDSRVDFKKVFNFEEEFTLLPQCSFDNNTKEWEIKYSKSPKKKRTASSKK